jgi:hypothetical protein
MDLSPSQGPAWRLQPHVHAVSVDEDVVLLDIAADAYLCLPDVGDGLTLLPDLWRVTFRDAELQAELASAGLIAPDVRAAPPPRLRPALPTRTAVRAIYPRPQAGDLLEGLTSVADLGRHYRNRSFADILRLASPDGSPPATTNAASPTLLAAVDRFHRWVPYAPVSGKCLLRSFMLRRRLLRQGYNAAWVFGVATWPFKAHCWLQCGDTVLDDAADRVAAYTPIFAL